MKKLSLAIPLLIAGTLIAYACTRTSSQSPSSTVTSAAAKNQIHENCCL